MTYDHRSHMKEYQRKRREDPEYRRQHNASETARYRIANGVPSPTRERPAVCECCGQVPKRWNIDHDHKTGAFRGWLCIGCNTAIGKLGDTVEGLKQAVAYLERVYG